MEHTHVHRLKVGRYLKMLAVAPVLALVYGLGVFYSGSFALTAEALHVVLVDNAVILIAIIAAAAQGLWRKNVEKECFNASVLILLALVFFVFAAAVHKMLYPENVEGMPMLVAAVFGTIGNRVQHYIHHQEAHEHRDRLHRSVSLELDFDLWENLAVILGAAIVWATGWVLVDPIISFGIAIWISWRISKLWKDPYGHHH